jgi:hypothetical protein
VSRPAEGRVSAGVTEVVAGIRVAADAVWRAARDYQDEVSAEADALVALVDAAEDADPARVADARAVLAEVLRRRDRAAARLGVAGPDALTVQLHGLLAAGCLAVAGVAG